MGLLKKAESSTAYAKIGILGFPGSGKTWTAMEIAIGLAKLTQGKPVAFMDTETGSDFMIPKVKEAGLELLTVKSRAFQDMMAVVKEAEASASVLIVDSITHVWRDLCDSYCKKLGRSRLQFQDWQIVKGEWARYTDAFVNSRLHIIVCGRAGFEYDYDYNEDGSKDLIKTGTKMKVETEFGFEPSLLVEMERVTQNVDELERIRETHDRKAKQGMRAKAGAIIINRAHVVKDRTNTIQGKQFDYPTFADFEPHLRALNLGGTQMGVDTSRDSTGMFNIEGRPEWKEREDRRQISMEKVEATMTKVWPSSSSAEKRIKVRLIELAFGTPSWKEVQRQKLEELEERTDNLMAFINGLSPEIAGDPAAVERAWGAFKLSQEARVKEARVEGQSTPETAPTVKETAKAGTCKANPTVNDDSACAKCWKKDGPVALLKHLPTDQLPENREACRGMNFPL